MPRKYTKYSPPPLPTPSERCEQELRLRETVNRESGQVNFKTLQAELEATKVEISAAQNAAALQDALYIRGVNEFMVVNHPGLGHFHQLLTYYRKWQLAVTNGLHPEERTLLEQLMANLSIQANDMAKKLIKVPMRPVLKT